MKEIPNCDERCSFGWSFEEALRLLIYTLTIISVFLIAVGCVRSCVVRTRLRNAAEEGQSEDGQDGFGGGRRHSGRILVRG